ncbi:phosphoenolpyruvate--protein phosphotransferase [Actinomadura sp. HBU206391]|uniref:phosphoenolpyruvate--protein phosphotransferase n=1 Tax=Actinomadura sp. HBU206391 TaxID=2731692 RepID=UPI0016508F22|nr:phosphoenolpyruvate--protein phosphotransferase [Actinomadura sp. HBU206391]MBC6461688.1 phosphoenolpyruvate--protein phosphotransferase [Actinomadura sp. HBU206391]
MSEVLRGIGVGPGLTAGPILRMAPPLELPPPRTLADAEIEPEVDLAVRALASVQRDLRERADATADATTADILHAQVALAADPVLEDDVIERIRSGTDAPHAIREAFDEHRAALEAIGGLFAERIGDLDDLAGRALAVALGRPAPGVPAPGHRFILVADDLAPADTAGLDPATVLALVTERGGPTSHTAIIARSVGIPAVVGCRGILGRPDDDLATVNGTTGEVHVGVGQDDVAEILAQVAKRQDAGGGRGPGRTADGRPVDLLVNIGSAADLAGVEPVEVSGVAGVGLFRTEFLFLDREKEPTFDEQVLAYAEVFRAAGSLPVVVRTLDAGADKPLPFLGLPEEPNPALGMRGLRVARVRPQTLDVQLAAIAEAAAQTDARVEVMAPMVATAAEAADFVERARGHGLGQVGVMVEVPAAALHADRLLEYADFLSIGTNDLAQYTLAVDRQNGDLPDLLDPWQPALLQLIGRCADAGRVRGKPVSVCGEAAGDPLLAPVLVGLGIGKLSMAQRGVAAVRATLAEHDMAACGRMADAALDTGDAAAARTAALAAG